MLDSELNYEGVGAAAPGLDQDMVETGEFRQLGTQWPARGLLAQVRQSFVTRRVDLADCHHLLRDQRPLPGDLAIARVERIGQQMRLQLASGRRGMLYPGDRVLVCYGNRYAPDQYEAVVPNDLGECQLVTAGGVAGQVLSRHPRLKPPTVLQPEGLLADQRGVVLNLRRYGLPVAGHAGQRKPVIGVLGTSMNSGKTTALAALVRGLSLAGLRVAAIKATGTGSGNDLWSMEDAGAHLALDFTDMGYPSTYRVADPEIEALLDRLLTYASQQDTDVTVVEVADGLFHQETANLVVSQRFRASVDQVLFCAGDALGARAGVEWLEERGIPLAGVSGVVTASQLASREALQATGLPVWTKEQLSSPEVAMRLLGSRQ